MGFLAMSSSRAQGNILKCLYSSRKSAGNPAISWLIRVLLHDPSSKTRLITYYLVTKSKVITGKSQTEALMYWPSDSEVNTSSRGLRFPCNYWTDEVNKLLILCGLFIMDLSLWSVKTHNRSADNFKKICHLNELYTWSRGTVRWHWSADTLFDSCQLTITWMSILKDVHCQVKHRLFMPWTPS